ncbi:hypothetical protein SLA2020_193850 [Shorea laevis]
MVPIFVLNLLIGTGSVEIMRRRSSTPGIYRRESERMQKSEKPARGATGLGKFSMALFVSANASHDDSSVYVFTDSIRYCLPQQMRQF